jgi:hypothetical protein
LDLVLWIEVRIKADIDHECRPPRG